MSFTLAGLCHPPDTLHAAAARQFTNGLFVRVPSHQLYAHAGSNTWSGEGIRTYRFLPQHSRSRSTSTTHRHQVALCRVASEKAAFFLALRLGLDLNRSVIGNPCVFK